MAQEQKAESREKLEEEALLCNQQNESFEKSCSGLSSVPCKELKLHKVLALISENYGEVTQFLESLTELEILNLHVSGFDQKLFKWDNRN
ncbi:hypothetical protein VNO78_15386 [Psophocarpus tetragonolobus]|uniref:Uncharacterized protein n=1 Tax=Psophocarpus tetragonolobus TaxID=3891 RepID=A0AAN9XJK1_PSOTE